MFAITERLLLRPGWAEDASMLARAIGESKVARNLARVPWPYTLADAERFLATPADPARPIFLLALRETGELVGGIGIHGVVEAEIGYWIAAAHWGRGYATEAGRALVALADGSLRLPRLIAHHALENPASGRVLRKLGFRPGGTGKLHSVARGQDMDVRHFARERACAQAEPLAA